MRELEREERRERKLEIGKSENSADVLSKSSIPSPESIPIAYIQ